MFTGLIESVGTVLKLRETPGAMRLIIAAPDLAGRWKLCDSIAVNCVCLTALAHLQPGALVNLELPTPSGSPMGGHVVQGHVDATGKLISLIPLHSDLNRTDWRMTIEVPPSIAPNIVSQGSITIDGISLTVAKVDGLRIEIAIIPHTYKATNLHSLMSGSPVNLEADVLSKYAAQRIAYEAPAAPTSLAPPAAPELIATPVPQPDEWLTPAYLLANGY
jgi:riboflavin synthase